MPATSLQSRISAFESLSGPSLVPSKPVQALKSSSLVDTPISPAAASLPIAHFSLPKVPPRSPSPSPPNLGRKTSLIDLKDWVVDDGPPKYNGFAAHHTNGKPGGINDFTQMPTHRVSGFDSTKTSTNGRNFVSTPLISLESPPKPPLPPRKAYQAVSTPGAPKSIVIRHASSTSLPPPKRSDSLTVEHTYPPPLAKPHISDASRRSPGHVPASSISSLHSVSLSSDGPSTPGSVSNFISTFPMDQDGSEADTVSLDESYENVSVSSIASPTTAATLALNWEKAMAQRGPPKLPQRPPPKPAPIPVPPPTATSAPVRPRTTHSPPYPSSHPTTVRRVPPPPPLKPASSRVSPVSNTASDRSSIISTATSTTSRTSILSQAASNQLTLSRPTPVPAAARKRYEAVFVANVVRNRKQTIPTRSLLSARKSRQAAGWRGLSVDLITNPGEHPLDSANGKGASEEKMEKDRGEVVRVDERLDGSIVKLIWSTSKLDKGKLRDIWNECAITNLGSLDRDSFVKGMWRIDEELRRAHTKAPSASSVSMAPLASYSSRSRQPKLSNPKLILR